MQEEAKMTRQKDAFKQNIIDFIKFSANISGVNMSNLNLMAQGASGDVLMLKFNKNFMKYAKFIDLSMFTDMSDKDKLKMYGRICQYNEYCLKNVEMFSVFGDEYIPLFKKILTDKNTSNTIDIVNMYNFYKFCNYFVILLQKFVASYTLVNGKPPF